MESKDDLMDVCRETVGPKTIFTPDFCAGRHIPTSITAPADIRRACYATVRFHIHNAATKLEAVNRSQTVFKAAQLGYLGSVTAIPSGPQGSKLVAAHN